MKLTTTHSLTLLLSLFLCQGLSAASDAPAMRSQLHAIQQQWAVIQYQVNGTNARLQALEALTQQAADLSARYPERAEPKIWQGIVLSSHAGLDGGLAALKKVKRARQLFERAIEIDETALRASAHVSLGALYYQVPPWPLAFGSNRKARLHLERALEIAPNNVDGNYFLAGFLEKAGEYQRAIKRLKFAAELPDRPHRPVADAGRRDEIITALKRVREASLN